MALSIRAQWLGACLLLAGSLAAACGSDSNGGSSPAAGAGGGGEAAAAEGGTGEPSGGSSVVTPPGGADAQPGGADSGGAGLGGAASTDFIDRLDHLGAKTDLPVAPHDPDGALLPDGYHPLKKAFATIDPHQEIYYGGPSILGSREGVLDDGFSGNFAPLLASHFQSWLTADYRAAVAADVDGDGIDEFVLVYYDAPAKKLMAKVTHGPNGGMPAKDDEPFFLANVTTPTDEFVDWFQHSVAAANIDADPADELIVGFTDLYFFDDLNHKMAELTASHETLNSKYISVAKGDFDAKPADPQDELIVMFTAPGNVQKFQIYDGINKTLEPEGRTLRPTLTDKAHSQILLQQGFAVAGEFDGDDAQQEIAILSGDAYRWRLLIMDDAKTDFRTFDSFMYDLSGDDVSLAAADIDGDGVDELWCVDWIFDHLEDLPLSNDRTDVDDRFQDNVVKRIDPLINPKIVRRGVVSPDLGTPSIKGVQQFVAIDPGSGGRIVYSARNPIQANRFDWVSIGTAQPTNFNDVLAVGNADFDSAVVRYTGDHELLYAQPELLVALAAPPFYAGTNQEANSSTSFGRGTSEKVEHASSLGFSVGFSIGYESKDPLGISSSSFSISVNAEFDATKKNSTTVSDFITYASGAEDSVVFTVVPFDVYYYEVVSAPDASQVGNTLSVNLPRAPQTLLATSEYFDQYVDDSRKSAPLFATHVVGEPLSYPTAERRNDLCNGACYKTKTASAIGQGNGSTTLEISKTDGEGTAASYKLSTEVRSEASLGGVKVGSSFGFSYGYSIESTTEDTMVFTGKIGSLKGLTPENGYSVGLFAHQQVHPTSIKPILVIDYWVAQ